MYWYSLVKALEQSVYLYSMTRRLVYDKGLISVCVSILSD